MRILFIADGRSPTAISWIKYWIQQGHETHLVSTYSVEPELDLESTTIIPVAFSQAAGPSSNSTSSQKGSWIKKVSTTGMRTRFRQWVGPLTIPRASKALESIYEEIQPDLVHALRIPYESMLAAQANPIAPLIVSVWGNDFTLHAGSTPLMRRHTKKTVRRVDALIADCQRDVRLAKEWGFPETRPTIVLPGAGGLQLDQFYPPRSPGSAPVVINPRGVRTYVRNDTFFKAVPLVLAQRSETRFLCPAMQGKPQPEKWVDSLGIRKFVELLPNQNRSEMADLFRQALVVVSPSEHDGSPNSLLEAMACGCFPVAGDIESIREWITNNENGLLIDPADPKALAQAILTALDDADLRSQAQHHNIQLIKERAEYGAVMQKAEEFYGEIVGKVRT